ncbi:MAG: hypothetical protein AB7K71_00510 [Polyangiaceae bacterium]
MTHEAWELKVLPGPRSKEVKLGGQLIKPDASGQRFRRLERLSLLPRPALYWANLEVARAHDLVFVALSAWCGPTVRIQSAHTDIA